MTILKTIMKWVGFGLGILVAGIWAINSDFVSIILPIRTLFPILLFAAALMALTRRSKITIPAAILYTALGIFIFASGRAGYSEETISFQNAGATLEGTLYVPEGAGPYPTAVIVHGSLCVPRRLYHVVAVHMARNGIAVFSFDKRGTGASGGFCVTDNNTSLENLDLLAGDINAALIAASENPNVNTSRLGLWGISQAGWIAPLVATKHPDIAFIAMVSGPSVSVGEENYYSSLTGDGHGEADGDFTQAEIEAMVEAREPSQFDPYDTLVKINTPTLWVYGGKDNSIPVKKSIKRLESLQNLGKNYEVIVYPLSSHALVEMTFPYDFSKGFLDAVATWIKAQPPKLP